MTISIITFTIATVLRILAGVFVEQISWVEPLLGFMTFLSVFFGVIMVLFIIANIIKAIRK